MRLYDTARAEVVPFEPTDRVVTMYTCGITPYDSTHLGHAATYLTYDVLQRRLRDLGHETRCVRNITDVDDSILPKARELGVHYLDLAASELARFDADMERLEMLPAWSEPRATSAIPDIRGFIGMVLDQGYAYQAGGSVYFEVAKFPKFGSISGYSREEMLAYAAERGGNVDDPHKRDPLDFVLWQPSLADEPSWDSLWGPGRPGWHIECSALCLRELGTTIDLHGGGSDLIFPHHECEAAQSEAATGEPLVRHWMHQAMVRMDGEKMSKSLGNLVFVSELSKDWDPRGDPPRLRRLTTTATAGSGTTRSCPPRPSACPRGSPRASGERRSMRCAGHSTTTSTHRPPSQPSTRPPARGSGCPRRRRCSGST